MPLRIVDVLNKVEDCTLVGIMNRLGIIQVLYIESQGDIPKVYVDTNKPVNTYYWGDLLTRHENGNACPCPCLWIEI